MKKKTSRNLDLCRESLHVLELDAAAGGGIVEASVPFSGCNTHPCGPTLPPRG